MTAAIVLAFLLLLAHIHPFYPQKTDSQLLLLPVSEQPLPLQSTYMLLDALRLAKKDQRCLACGLGSILSGF